MEGLGKLTYELSSTNILDKMTLKYQYTRSMMENAFFFWVLFIYLFFTYTNAHTLIMKKISPKDDINDG